MPHVSKRERRYAASYKFDRLSALNQMQDEGGAAALAAGKAKRQGNDTWVRRASNNVTGFHKPAAKRAPKDAGTVKSAQVLKPTGPMRRAG